jgi:uncharacterized protein (TIGR02453 family)
LAAPFTGFPREAFEFFKGLAKNNNRDWFQAHKDTYEHACREPMKDLMTELEPQFGPSKISRINRDMRFAYGREPYKTHMAAGVGGFYVSLSQDGLYVGTGIYKPDPATLRRLRAAIDSEASGRELTTIVAGLRRKGYQVDTHESVASVPRGYAADHARIDLLRMKDIFAGKSFGPEPWLSTGKALERMTRVMADLEPFRKWVRRHTEAQSPKPKAGSRSRRQSPD